MSMVDENGIIHNSFYETDRELGIETRTEEELIEYKRLIGMPITEDYDELISSLKTLKTRKRFDDYSFIRLFFACMRINNQIFFDKESLRYDLYFFKSDEEYRELFQDISVKQAIEGNFLNIEEALQNANLLGVISLANNINNSKSLILLDEDYSRVIIANCDREYAIKMNNLVKELINKKEKEKKIKQIKY